MKKVLRILLPFILLLLSCGNTIVVNYDEPIIINNFTYEFVHVSEGDDGDSIKFHFYLNIMNNTTETIKISLTKPTLKNGNESYTLSYYDDLEDITIFAGEIRRIDFRCNIPTFTDDGEYYFSINAEGNTLKYLI